MIFLNPKYTFKIYTQQNGSECEACKEDGKGNITNSPSNNEHKIKIKNSTRIKCSTTLYWLPDNLQAEHSLGSSCMQ